MLSSYLNFPPQTHFNFHPYLYSVHPTKNNIIYHHISIQSLKTPSQIQFFMMMMKINDEYLCAVRTKSFADFFVQAQHLLADDLSYPTHCHPSDLLLNPGQEAIASLLKSSPKSPHLKSLFSDYFTISAEASRLCTNLLTTLIRLRNHHRSITQILDAAAADSDLAISGLILLLDDYNPFSDLNELRFKEIHDRHSSILQQLRSSRKKMAGKLRMIELLSSMIGPALFGVPVKKRMMRWFRIFKCGIVVRRVVEQLDAAAKGAYILKRDFDTIERLVARIGGEMEHERAVVGVCLERGRGGCLEVLKKGEFGVSRQAEELEEHVYLCLLTINRARAMVVTQICRNSAQDY